MNSNANGLGMQQIIRHDYSNSIAIFLIVAIIVLGPLLMGGTPSLVRAVLEMIMAAAVLFGSRSPLFYKGPLFLFACTAVLALVQLLPYPHGFIAKISPKLAYSSQQIEPMGIVRTASVLSNAPGNTLYELRRLFLLAGIVITVSYLAQSSRVRETLTTILLFVVFSVAALGIFLGESVESKLMHVYAHGGPFDEQQSSIVDPVESNGYGEIDWVSVGELGYYRTNLKIEHGFGTFAYSNHFASFLGITVPVSLGVGLSLADRFRQKRASIYLALTFWIALAVSSAGLLAESRAGAVSLIVGCLVTIALKASKMRVFVAALTVTVLVLAVVFLPYVEMIMSEIFCGPTTISAEKHSVWSGIIGRLRLTTTAFELFMTAPWAGNGLGTFGTLYQNFYADDITYCYAHNDIAQWIAETGVIGCGILIAVAVWIIRTILACSSFSLSGFDAGLFNGIVGGIVAAALHCCVDWIFHNPSNATMVALLIGLLVGLECSKRAGESSKPPKLSGLYSIFVVTTVLVCCLSTMITVRTEMVVRNLRSAVSEHIMNGQESSVPQSPGGLRRAIALAEKNGYWSFLDAKLAESLGQAYLHVAQIEGDAALEKSYGWFARSLSLVASDHRIRRQMEMIAAKRKHES